MSKIIPYSLKASRAFLHDAKCDAKCASHFDAMNARFLIMFLLIG
jgi:hypothetical protein